MIDTVDTSAGSDTDRSFITTLRNSSGELSILDAGGADGSAVRRTLARGNHGTLTVGPEGTAVGKPKYVVPVHITAFSTEYPYDGVVEFSANWQGDGAFTSDFEALGSTF